MSIKYVKLPIYSVAVYGEYIYFAGGGGGSTGIPNQIKIYHQRITPEPVNSLETGKYIIQNLTVCESRQLLFCNANQFIVVYRVEQNGRNLVELTRFQADFTKKHPNVNALCISNDSSVIMAGGQDMTVRFYNYSQNQPEIIHQYAVHNHQLKNVDHNQKDLFLSTDNHMIAICNLPKKQIVRTIYQDQLLPQKCYLRSAQYAYQSQEVAIVHFLSRTSTFITKESKGKFKTIEVANDQCSQTAYNPQVQILGVACGNGLTSLVSINNMKQLGSQNELKSGVNACVITRRSNLISGTSNCSYHIQGPSGSLSLPFPALLPSLLLTCIFIYLIGSVDDFEL